MKLRDLRGLESNEVAVVLDNGTKHVAVSEHNQNGGLCDCCKNRSVSDAEVVLIRDAVTGKIVWQP